MDNNFIFEEDPSLNLPTESGETYSHPKKETQVKPPAALKPSVDWDGEEVEVTSELYAEPVKDWDTLLNELGYDPQQYEIVEPVKLSSWDATVDGEAKRLYSYKINLRTKQTTQYRDEDYKDLVGLIRKHRPLSERLYDQNCTLVICLADWQLGKADGDGTSGTIKRLMQMIDDVDARIRELKASGRKIARIIIAGVGDMVESCANNYATQTFTVQLNRRQQIRVLRRLLTKAITKWAKAAPDVIVTAVPGNHGENRNGSGRYFTTRGDNDDVAVFEMVAEILTANPEAYGHVKFVLPEEDIYTMIPTHNDVTIGFYHGHVNDRGAGDPQKKIRDWWRDQSFAKAPIANAKILVTAHYHHFSVIEYDNDTIHFQCPSEDGGSEWFEDLKGVKSRPGTLTFVVDDSGRPYRDLEII